MNPKFDKTKHKIGAGDIQNEAQKLLTQLTPHSFPVSVFPSAIQHIIESTNQNLQFPIDFIGASILGAVGLAIGNTHKVQPKRGWEEGAVLFIALVGRAGTNKSHPLTFAFQPIQERDKISHFEYGKAMDEYNEIMALTAKERKQQNLSEPQKPILKKYLLSDFTPEALALVHKQNPRGIGVLIDELAGWFKNFNRYHKGGEQEAWLSLWSGKAISIDRKTSAPIYIPTPFVSVIGTIQNGVLEEMSKDNRSQNGFMDRILFAMPEELKKEYWSDAELPPAIGKSWSDILNRLLDLPLDMDSYGNAMPTVLKFAPDAMAALKDWQKRNTDLSNHCDNESLSSIYSKLESYAIRLSLILEMLFWACGETSKESVGLKAVNGALILVEYFREAAHRVHFTIFDSSPLDRLPANKKLLFEALPTQFKTEEGVQTAEKYGIPERTFKRFLNEKGLFEKIGRGEYEKRL